MIYKAPFFAVSKAVYSGLSTATTIGLQWFDASVPIKEVEAQFKGQTEFAYGIFGTSSADCLPNKDMAIWECSLRLEIYSNYKGRKVISQKLEALLNYFSSDAGWQKLQSVFTAQGYQLLSMNVGTLIVNPPLYTDIGVWQSGTTEITFKINQLEEA